MPSDDKLLVRPFPGKAPCNGDAHADILQQNGLCKDFGALPVLTGGYFLERLDRIYCLPNSGAANWEPTCANFTNLPGIQDVTVSDIWSESLLSLKQNMDAHVIPAAIACLQRRLPIPGYLSDLSATLAFAPTTKKHLQGNSCLVHPIGTCYEPKHNQLQLPQATWHGGRHGI